MTLFSRTSVVPSILAVVLSLSAVGTAEAQVDPRDVPIVAQPQQRFDYGQDVQPIYEGWTRNDDGSYLLHFGYFNRNYTEQPHVPIGPSNYFSPGPEDRGQPTYFYPRTQHYQFTVSAPATMGRSFDDAVVWTLIVHGSEQKAYGWLQPEWEIDALTITSNQGMGRGHDVETLYGNEPPTVTVEASASTVSVGESVTLTAALDDDALPPVLPPRPRSDPLPALKPPEDLPQTPDNVQSYRRPQPPRNGLSALWVVYRGPADVEFDPAGFQRALVEEGAEVATSARSGATAAPEDEATSLEGDGLTRAKFQTTATFSEPGSYTLRVWGTDSMHKAPGDLTITVTE